MKRREFITLIGGAASAYRHPTTIDATAPCELAAIEVIRRKPDEGGNLFAAHLAEFGQERDQRASQHGAYPRHGSEQPATMGESRIGCNDLDQALVGG